jgi:hypothetical protein
LPAKEINPCDEQTGRDPGDSPIPRTAFISRLGRAGSNPNRGACPSYP